MALRPVGFEPTASACSATRALVARMTGLEPAASGVTGRRSARLSYIPAYLQHPGAGMVACWLQRKDSNLQPIG